MGDVEKKGRRYTRGIKKEEQRVCEMLVEEMRGVCGSIKREEQRVLENSAN
jgi:hypothetical protein